jgi:AcrR family transcriptional regulator
MPRDSRRTRQRILDAAYVLFRRKGYTRVSMDEIAAATRVTKRTLYYHFTSKDELLAAVLEAQHHLALAAFRTFGENLSGSPENIVDTLFRDLAVWSDEPRWAGSGFTRLVVELADLPGHPARKIARRHKALLEAYLAELFAKANVDQPHACAREVWLLSEGAISLILVHRDRSYAAAAAQAARKLIRLRITRRKAPAAAERHQTETERDVATPARHFTAGDRRTAASRPSRRTRRCPG